MLNNSDADGLLYWSRFFFSQRDATEKKRAKTANNIGKTEDEEMVYVRGGEERKKDWEKTENQKALLGRYT